MEIILKERIVIRDNRAESEKYNEIINSYSRTIDSYISNGIIPRIGEILCVKKDGLEKFYDVMSVIHYYSDSYFTDYEYEVCIEVKEHEEEMTSHTKFGYEFKDHWPLITRLKEKSEDHFMEDNI